MKKLIYVLMLVLTAGVFSSCQKGEYFFNGTWQNVDDCSYYDEQQDCWVSELCITELTLDKRQGTATMVQTADFIPSWRQYNNTGTYKLYNDYTIAITFPRKVIYHEEGQSDLFFEERNDIFYKNDKTGTLYNDTWGKFTKLRN